jgi:serine/threonine protein kinase
MLWCTFIFIVLCFPAKVGFCVARRSGTGRNIQAQKIGDELLDMIKTGTQLSTDSIARKYSLEYGSPGAFLSLIQKDSRLAGTTTGKQLVREIVASGTRLLETQMSPSARYIGEDLAASVVIWPPNAIRDGGAGGRCKIITCVPIDGQAGTYIAKVVKNRDRFVAERETYLKVAGRNGNPRFVRHLYWKEDATRDSHTIIMTRGCMNLAQVTKVSGPLRRGALKYVAIQMTLALLEIHRKGLCWTDLKLDNFVLTPSVKTTVPQPFTDSSLPEPMDSVSSINELFSRVATTTCRSLSDASPTFIVQAIDLESCTKVGGTCPDISAEILAPEQVAVISSGSITQVNSAGVAFRIDLPGDETLKASKQLDIWSLGISVLQLYLGQPPVTSDGNSIRKACDKVTSYMYEYGGEDLGLSEIADPKLKTLLSRMLRVEPSKRPSIFAVLASFMLL